MAFNLSEWLMRRRIGAQVRDAGRSVEHSRIANPYHAVSIELGSKACAAARKLEGRRYPFGLRTDAAGQGLHPGGLPVPLRAPQGPAESQRDRRVQFRQSACAQDE